VDRAAVRRGVVMPTTPRSARTTPHGTAAR
jgi:hypothetical protein